MLAIEIFRENEGGNGPLQEAVDLVGARLADALDGGEGGEVVPLHCAS